MVGVFVFGLNFASVACLLIGSRLETLATYRVSHGGTESEEASQALNFAPSCLRNRQSRKRRQLGFNSVECELKSVN